MSSKKIWAIIDIECVAEREFGFDRTALRIAKFPQVMEVAVVSGRADLMVRYEADDVHEISKFVTEVLAPMDGVESTATHFFMKQYKKDGKILVEEPKASRLPVSA
jgi:DNA-binding Lrp family transcriptional regulator